MNFQQARQELKNHNLEVFTSQDFINLFNIASDVSAVKLSRYKKLGYLISPKKGVFYLKGEVDNKFRIANRIYNPSYISLDSALSKYNIIPETVYTVTSVTTKATREFDDEQTTYRYYKIKTQAYAGYVLVDDAFVADPEKSVVDYLYFVALGKRVGNDRMDLTKLDRQKIFDYANLFDDRRLNKLVNIAFSKQNVGF
ncbi:MAG: hypothetical protein G01um101416_714 [Microgenomates group bacterium Gr01-1014_16]|nr:MAG: hypothetical protein G01um101416_714 [Microgenomates group bacterium Gr01-1014_16]